VNGLYFADWEHGGSIEIKGCDTTFLAHSDGAALDKINAYKEAYQAMCGGPLMNERISGRLTGLFIRDKKPHRFSFVGRSAMITSSRFVITDFESDDYDASTISCPK
jgi:hypothetical protein